MFAVTNVLIAFLAAGMAGQAAAVLHGADLLPGWGEQLWNTSWLLDDNSLAGRTLHALIGYSALPNWDSGRPGWDIGRPVRAEQNRWPPGRTDRVRRGRVVRRAHPGDAGPR